MNVTYRLHVGRPIVWPHADPEQAAATITAIIAGHNQPITIWPVDRPGITFAVVDVAAIEVTQL